MVEENVKRVKALIAEVAVERNPERFEELVQKLRVVLEGLRPVKPAKPTVE